MEKQAGKSLVLLLCAAFVLSGCGGSDSVPPQPDTTPPTAPSGLAATAISTSQINLSWTASTDNVGVTGYRVERCQGTNCSNFAQVATPAGITFSDTGLAASTSYSYRVRASDAAGNLSGYSNTASATTQTAQSNISVSLSPKRVGLTVTQSMTFTATITNDAGNQGVTWSATAGTFSNQTGTTATYTAPATAGAVTITATSKADTSKSAQTTLGITDLAGVFTYHNNLSRDGTNQQEYALTTANVSSSSFGKLFSCQADGAIYAQPLWVANVIVGGVKRNVVIVATQHDSVYAFDADAKPCVTLWHANLLDTAHGGGAGETPVPSGGTGSLVGSGYGDIQPEVGVTGTPVIDPATNIVYVVSKSVNASTQFFQRLHALDITTGSEKLNGNKPVVISASVPGDGDGSSGGNVPFDPQNENQRSGLTLLNGVIYIAWASHEDHDPYHGWVLGYDASTLAPIPSAVFNSTPNAVTGFTYSRGGIWMSGGAPAADSSSLYLITGNGSYDGKTNFSDSIIRLGTSTGLKMQDWFTPSDQSFLDSADLDLGSGGAVVLVDLPAPAPITHLLIGGGKAGSGKTGEIYLLNRDLLGGFTTTDAGAVQMFPLGSNIFSTPAFWQNRLYVAGAGGPLTSFTFNPTTGLFTNVSTPSQTSAIFSFPGASPSISSQAATNGIVWVVDSSAYCTPQSGACGPAILRAYDAVNLSHELWDSSQGSGNAASNAVKFTVPTVANGKVYIGTRGNNTGTATSSNPGELDVYGLLPN